MADLLTFSPKLTVLPVLHGSGDFMVRVREELLAGGYGCLAVPLPASMREEVLAAVELLPAVSVVGQETDEEDVFSYVPIDPCQAVIGGIRTAVRSRMAVEFVDLESHRWRPGGHVLPDPYAIKRLPVEQFAAACLPDLPRPEAGSLHDRRARRLGFELHKLELEYGRTLALVHLSDWPWVREAYLHRLEYPEHETYFAPIHTWAVTPDTLTFLLGELPYVTALYERARREAGDDGNLSLDGLKSLLLESRRRWESARPNMRNWLGPKLLTTYLQYVRNLSLMERRLTPDLYTLVVAAQQIGGDRCAIALIETAKDYALEFPPGPHAALQMGIGEADLPEIGEVRMLSRLPGQPVQWRSCKLVPEPPAVDRKKYAMRWDPYEQCSFPPEDDLIENFHAHVREQAKRMLGQDLARSEKFTTSVRDGIDVRETLRHWHTGEIHVKEIPPSRGELEAVVMLFDVPADPDRYVWRTTWHAEHDNESTLGLFATDFRDDLIGPGIGRAQYGGVMFLYPPRFVTDVWTDRTLAASSTLEERLIHAACRHSTPRHVALISPVAPRLEWRRLARDLRKKLVHIPLSRFSQRTIDRLRTVHVLNGKDVRSYAAQYIRGE